MAYNKYMASYNDIRQTYRPKIIHFLLISESPPPAANVQSSRHFYRTDSIRRDDRLFANTIRALYPQTAALPETQLETDKQQWLKTLQHDGFYMIEALPESQKHAVTKEQRQQKIHAHLPELIAKVRALASPTTRIILIKSNVFEVAAEPLRQAGFTVLNNALVDYPGRFNQRDYREKLAALVAQAAA